MRKILTVTHVVVVCVGNVLASERDTEYEGVGGPGRFPREVLAGGRYGGSLCCYRDSELGDQAPS